MGRMRGFYRCGLVAALLLLSFSLTRCMRWEYGAQEEFAVSSSGLFITNEGNFQYGNASLSYYDPDSRQIENEIFYRANAMRLGDVAQSMTIYGNRGWIVVNNSHAIFAIDLQNFKEVGRITNLTSPRYIHFVSEDKAYVTQIWDNRICIVNPKRYEVTGYIECPNMSMESGSTEQMVQYGNSLFVSCWSYQNRILKIDTTTDSIVAELVVGTQPSSMVLDRRGKLWCLCDGGFEGSPYGDEVASLCCVDAKSFTIDQRFEFGVGDTPSELHISTSGDRLYWIDDAVWAMSVEATAMPSEPFIKGGERLYYGLTISPYNGDVYVADAIDYQQQGKVYRYSSVGELVDEFYVGVTPGAFCWK